MNDRRAPGFCRWLGFWLCVPLFWLAKDDGYWTIQDGPGSSHGYRRFSDFRKEVLGE